jgi:hypothetical protein
MKAVAIDPVERRIVVEDVDPTPAELRRMCGAPRRVLATLPNGDVVLAAEGEGADAGFSIGGSKAIRSTAIVLGRRNSFGDRTAARSSVGLLAGLVRWVKPALVSGLSGDAVTVIVVDPEIGLIDHADMDRTAAGIERLLGGKGKPLLKAPGNDIVYGNAATPGWRWKKDDCVFNGRCVIVGSDRANAFAEPVASIKMLRREVRFGPPGKALWLGYDKHPAKIGACPK